MIRLGVIGYGSRISGMISGPFRSVEPDLRVVGVVKGTAKTRTPIEVAIQSVYACLAARESAEKGRFTTVRQLDSGTQTPNSGG